MTGRSRENYNKNYLKYVNSFDPPTQHFKTCGRAFMVGGLICCIGQFLRFMLEFAGLGIAAGNAMPALKAVAGEVGVTNDEDFVAWVIEKYGEI